MYDHTLLLEVVKKGDNQVLLLSERTRWDDWKDGTGTKATADVNLVTFQLYALAHKAQQMKKQVGVNAGERLLNANGVHISNPILHLKCEHNVHCRSTRVRRARNHISRWSKRTLWSRLTFSTCVSSKMLEGWGLRRLSWWQLSRCLMWKPFLIVGSTLKNTRDFQGFSDRGFGDETLVW